MDIISITSLIIFAVTFFFILTERLHRTVIGLVGAVAMILAGIALDFYHPHEAIQAIDFNTIGLLFGMMVVIVMLEKTGVFQYMGILTAKKSKGDPWVLLLALGALTAIFSMFLDNVTTIILIAPVTIIVTRLLNVSPVPILIAEAILSNVGGAGTLVGDPPNIIIGSAAGFSFNTFLIHALPTVIITWLVSVFVLRFFYRRELAEKPASLDKLLAMNEREAITDPTMLKKVLTVLGIVIALFFTHSMLHLEPAIVALIGAALVLLLNEGHKDPQPILEKTELSVLLFFTSLFILVGGLEHAGVLEAASHLIAGNASSDLLMTALIVLWVSAILSAIVDNIPMTVAMVPILLFIEGSGVPIDLIWWALVFGVGFGGNASPIGSSAGVIISSKLTQTAHPVSFMQWVKVGAPTTIAGLAVASVAIVVFFYTGFVEGKDFNPDNFTPSDEISAGISEQNNIVLN